MERLNTILHELGISKVKLAKYLGVSRQMIYNYLELEDLNKWPKEWKTYYKMSMKNLNMMRMCMKDYLKKIGNF